jgi:dipeptidyl aminopeptidase/acylaminoacyl peptidase
MPRFASFFSQLFLFNFLLMVGLAAADPSVAQEGRALGLEDYFRVESIGSPAISPDGGSVAFVRTITLEEENRRRSEIWLVATDGSTDPVRLTHPMFSSSSPRWSPDGKLLAFSSNRRHPGSEPEGESNIWFLRMEPPGGEAFQIEGVGGMPIFSPDNQWIAFTKETPAEAKTPPRYDSDLERRIHERFQGRIYDWMGFRFDRRGYLPDPRDPAATPPEELYIVPRAGRSPRKLTSLGVDVQSADWRPDGSALVVVADSHQRDEYTYERADLWLVSLDGSVRRLTDDGYNHSSPTWSPDGRFVTFRRSAGLNMVIESGQNHGAPVDLYVLPADGGEMTNVTADWDLGPGAPMWSSDGRFIYFSAGIEGSSHLFRVRAQGGAVEQVTRGARRLGGLSVSSAFDRLAYTVTDAVRPAEVHTARIDGSEEMKLTGFNDALLSEVALSPAEALRYPSEDGTEIEGWILLPRGYDPANDRCPMILAIHGGPHGSYGASFSFQFQLWAANGYAVLYTNPRGSTGYGEEFLYATWGGWGILDFEDVMAGVDHALKSYAVDEKRLGVTGYSYGGFLTDWAIGHTSRFRAAVSGAGISNWVSDYGTADIPRTKESEFYGPPWEPKSGELLRKLSPITYAGNVTTPTLFIHGESDFRVPIEQGEQMYTALKKRRVPAKFVRYPDSYHGGWTPWNTVHRYHQEVMWWAEHLEPSGEATP